jgi:transforming growth factor-beta-induced protein
MKWLAAVGAALSLAACGGDDGSSPGTIAQVAQQQGLTDLVAAASKAGLVDTLNAPNADLTVFAPTNQAFDQLATDLGFSSATAMVTALPATALKDILLYHVLSGVKNAQNLVAGPNVQPTLYSDYGQPATLSLNVTNGVAITDAALTTAKVTQADVGASNGVIHVVDKVLIPPGVLNVVQMAQVNPVFSSLVGAVVQTGLVDALSGPGPFTVFAPTNTAFQNAPTGLTTDQLKTVLLYHVLDKEVLASQIPFGTPIATLANQSITINSGTPPTITDTTSAPADIIATDVLASNGVIHVINKVLIPSL